MIPTGLLTMSPPRCWNDRPQVLGVLASGRCAARNDLPESGAAKAQVILERM